MKNTGAYKAKAKTPIIVFKRNDLVVAKDQDNL